MLGGVDLSEEQFVEIEAIWHDAGKKIKEQPEKRFEISQQAHAKILDTVLTPEQREQAKKGSSMGHGSSRRSSHGGGGASGPGPSKGKPTSRSSEK